MGRQIHLSVLPADAETLLTDMKSQHSVVVVKKHDDAHPAVEPIVSLSEIGNEV
jgi:hypothetical protein